MDIVFEVKGPCCDLALHPVSASTAETIREHGRGIYAEKYMEWWRRGKTSTYGARLCPDCTVHVYADGAEQQFSPAVMFRNAPELEPGFTDSKARYLAVFGYDDQMCGYRWIWRDVENFDPAKFAFDVQDWSRVMDSRDYLVLENVLYDGRPADDYSWNEQEGFTLIDPFVVELADLRQAANM